MKNKGNNLCTRNELKGILDIVIRKRGQATRAPPPRAGALAPSGASRRVLLISTAQTIISAGLRACG